VPDLDPAVKHAERIHQALQLLGLPDGDRAGVLVGVVVVCDWADGQGERWLTQSASPGMPWWQRDGLLHAALLEEWDDDEDGGADG
jgi:hypothetical protein